MNYSRLAITVFALLVSYSVPAKEDLVAHFTGIIAPIMPEAEITAVAPGPIAGLYEVMLGPSVLYMTKDGQYLVRGDIYDLKERANLTDKTRTRARHASFADLPEGSAIEFAPADGKPAHTIYVFTDIDCGYCRKMHGEIARLTSAGIGVRYLAFPRSGLQGESYDKAVAVWCAKDRQKALTDAKLGKEIAKSQCENPVATLYELGQSFGIRGTPAVYLDTGEELGGYIPANDLARILGDEEG